MSSDNSSNILEQKYNDTQNIIEADKFMAITLDDISFKLSQITELFIKNQQTLSSLLEYTIKNEERLSIIQREVLAEADSGEFLRRTGTATTTQFVIIDTNVAPGHLIKGYTVINDGPNNIYVGHNMAISSELDVDIIDVTSDTSRFAQVLPGEDIKFIFNRRRIRNVHILASGGNSTFRAWLTW